MSEKPVWSPKGKKVAEGPLRGHYKHGKVYRPALLAYEPTVTNDWLRDDLPDLLWPLAVVEKVGDGAMSLFTRFQQDALSLLDGEIKDLTLDGRLTSLERVPPQLRPAIVDILIAAGLVDALIPRELREVVSLYRDAPGRWLLSEPWNTPDYPEDPARTVDFLAKAIAATGRDEVNALVKAPTLSWSRVEGKLDVPAELDSILEEYPNNPDTRAEAESFIRNSFLAGKAADLELSPNEDSRALEWAGSFWNQNWTMTFCLVENSPEPEGHLEPHQITAGEKAASEKGLSELEDLWKKFARDVMDKDRSVNLYAPARHEVLCALVTRGIRAVASILRAPHQWTGEFGCHTMRILTESKIVMRWMLQQATEEVFERFQAYGLGKRKLLSRQVGDLVQQFENAPAFLRTLAEQLNRDVGGEWADELQEVNLDSTFSGTNLRRMAIESGSTDDYRHLFQSSTAVLHGEWWTLEDYVMQRCRNPLHRFHWIPSSMEFSPETRFVEVLLSHVRDLIELALEGLSPPEARGEPPVPGSNS